MATKKNKGARKKPRSAAQKAATAKMLAANRASQAGRGAARASKPRSSGRKPRSAAQRAATAKMIAANKAGKHGGHRGGGSHALAKRPRVEAASQRTSSGTSMAVAYAMENNIGWAEGLLGGFTGIAWGFAADTVIRLLGSHKVTPPATAPPAGQPVVYTDAPDAGQNYNWISVDGPMNAWQWGVGTVGFIVVPILVARFVFEPGLGRSTMQFMAFAGVMVVGGRGAVSLGSYLLRKTGLGQRIYAPEINAQQAEVLLKAAIKGDAKYQQPPQPAIPLAAGFTLTPPQAGVAGAPGNDQLTEAQRRAAGLGAAPSKHGEPPPPPPPPPDDADDAPPTRAGVGEAKPKQEEKSTITPMFSRGLQDRWNRSRRAVA